MHMAGHNTPSAHRCSATIHITDDGRILQHVLLGDIILHTELRVATENNVYAFRCLCRDFKGGPQKTNKIIRQHHAAVGQDPVLHKSLLGGYPLRCTHHMGCGLNMLPMTMTSCKTFLGTHEVIIEALIWKT